MSNNDYQITDWAELTQIAVTTTAGEPVTDRNTVCNLLADLFAQDDYDERNVEDEGDGIWLADIPAVTYDEAEADGGLFLTHSGGYVVEIPMP